MVTEIQDWSSRDTTDPHSSSSLDFFFQKENNTFNVKDGKFFFFLFFFFFVFLGPHLRYMEVPRPGGPIRAVAAGLHQSHSNTRSKPRLQPTPKLTAMLDLKKCWIFNPMSEARDGTRNPMVPSQISQPLSHDGNFKTGNSHLT